MRVKDSLVAKELELATDFAINDVDGDCAICLDLLQGPLQTPCRHLFCGECIRNFLLKGRGIEKGTGTCPLCRAALSIDCLFKPNLQDVDDDHKDDEDDDAMDDEDEESGGGRRRSSKLVKQEKGTKIVKEATSATKKRKVVAKKQPPVAADEEKEEKKDSAQRPPPPSSSAPSSSRSEVTQVMFDSKLNVLVRELNAMRAASSTHKALVFTQYLSTMELLKQTMAQHGFTYQTLEGHMTMRHRKRNLEEFRSNPQCAVFLLSMRSGAVGLTLTAASHVFILEPAINPALEQQAIGRIHRLGNVHKEVVVSYLLMQDSIEENIYQINLSKLALLEKARKAKEDAEGNSAARALADEEAGEEDDEDEDAAEQVKPRYGRHATNANVDSGAGINQVSQGSLQNDTALFRLGELDKLFSSGHGLGNANRR